MAARMAEAKRRGAPLRHAHVTRMTPKRAEAILDGGSLYWVIKGQIAARQTIVGIEPFIDSDGIGRCKLWLDGAVVAVAPRPDAPLPGLALLRGEVRPAGSRRNPAGFRRNAGGAASRARGSGAALGRDISGRPGAPSSVRAPTERGSPDPAAWIAFRKIRRQISDYTKDNLAAFDSDALPKPRRQFLRPRGHALRRRPVPAAFLPCSVPVKGRIIPCSLPRPIFMHDISILSQASTKMDFLHSIDGRRDPALRLLFAK